MRNVRHNFFTNIVTILYKYLIMAFKLFDGILHLVKCINVFSNVMTLKNYESFIAVNIRLQRIK